ncbi:SixA phosphatase family protein [Geodermatophilus siccatus]|uniref:SixA phosphatase family protein n=1 Tax=Geodermatophilus siccatus TaxID=1137991 RepID=UPI001FE215BC|nr:histidine phosphatase family protein [Geodermatophilus siccatus]
MTGIEPAWPAWKVSRAPTGGSGARVDPRRRRVEDAGRPRPAPEALAPALCRPAEQGADGCQTRPVQPRRLLLIRHAKAAGGPVDRERPLTADGVRQAAALGAWLEHAGLVPDRVLVSPARRAVQTWEQVGAALSTGVQPIGDARIHDNTVDALLAAIRETPEDALSVAVVGHNPSIGELAGVLDDGRGDPVARRGVESGVPAAGVAVFDLAVPFAAVAPGVATLRNFRVPGD